MNLTNFGHLNKMSFGMLAVFIAINSVLNFLSKSMKDNGFGKLGYYMLSTVGLTTAFCSMLGSAIVMKIGMKRSFILSALLYAVGIISLTLPVIYTFHKDSSLIFFNKTFITICTFVITCTSFGFAAGIIWTS